MIMIAVYIERCGRIFQTTPKPQICESVHCGCNRTMQKLCGNVGSRDVVVGYAGVKIGKQCQTIATIQPIHSPIIQPSFASKYSCSIIFLQNTCASRRFSKLTIITDGDLPTIQPFCVQILLYYNILTKNTWRDYVRY